MKQKLFALLLAVTLVLSLAACTASPSDSGSNTSASQAPAADVPDVPDFTDVDTSTIPGLEDGVLTVGLECAYAPYNWMQMDDSNGAVPISNVSGSYANGYDVMIAKRICEAYGWELEVVSSSWDSLTPAVQAGTMDANIAGQSMTADRMKEVDMAGPYYYATIVCLTSKDSPYASATSIADLAGGICTAQSGTIWYDSCLPQIPDANILSPADNAPAMIMQLQTGMADFICTDMPTAKGAAAKDDNLVVLDFSGTDGDFQFETEAERAENVNIGISVKKGNTQLKDAMDAVLSQLTAEDFDAIMDQAIAAQPATDDTDANLFVKLGQDMAQLWSEYHTGYLKGILNTLVLAVAATVIGCVIGLVCGILNTIPYAKQDPLPKRVILKVIRALVRIYVEDEYIRAAPGLTGFTKCGGNYAASIKAGELAEERGFSQVLWLDGVEKKYVEEVGSMNIMFKIDGKIYTAACTGTVLPGVTRRSIIELLKDWGYEVIEAKWLYHADFSQIEAVVHPESIVHSLVYFADGAALAQLGYPDMRVPIQLALTYPERLPCEAPLDLPKLGKLTFLPFPEEKFPCFPLAIAAGKAGGIMPTVLNAAAEEAVRAFLNGRITFPAIAETIQDALGAVPQASAESFLQLSEADKAARRRASKFIDTHGK